MELYKISVNRNTLTSKFEKSENMELTTLAYGRLKYQTNLRFSELLYLNFLKFLFHDVFVSRCLCSKQRRRETLTNKGA